MKIKITKSLLVSCVFALQSQAGAYAEASKVGAEHIHSEGEWMIGYNYMNMYMDDLYQDDSKISVTQVSGSMMTPIKMTMEMHMFHLMYGLSNNSTFMVMANYLDNEMTMRNAMNGNLSKMNSDGFGDTSVSLIQNLSNIYPFGNNSLVSLSLSLPTGAIDETNDLDVRLPYKMQLGSGTFDPSVTFSNEGNLGIFKYDYNLAALVRLGHNSEGYSRGDKYSAGYRLSYTKSKFTLTDALSYELNTKYDGIDNAIENVGMRSIARDATKQSGQILRYSFGLGYELAKKTNLLVEYSLPIYQNLDGPQLGESRTLNLSIQKSF